MLRESYIATSSRKQLRPDGYLKVLDFGIAKLIEHTLLTQDSQPSSIRKRNYYWNNQYMSPEQARGLPVDEGTDIWSLV